MVQGKELSKAWYKPGEIAKMLGVTPQTITNYRKNGMLEMKQDPDSGHWLADRASLIALLQRKGVYYDNSSRGVKIIYARVSSYDQKKNGDLDRQIAGLLSAYIDTTEDEYRVYTDVASGLNSDRKGLNRVIDDVMGGNVEAVYVAYPDRLTRFGFRYLEKVFAHFDTKIIVRDRDESQKDLQEELAEDMMSLLASFSGKLYGMRSRKNAVVKKAEALFEESENGSDV